MTTKTKTKSRDEFEHAKENAKGWLASIEEMLETLQGYEEAAKAEGWDGPNKDKFGATYFQNEDGSTWACATWQELCKSQDIEAERSESAEQTIHESVLSVEVRGGWHNPGDTENSNPEEYNILLTTGGPALRIFGRLSEHSEPESAELQMQDWGTPWNRYPAAEATLIKFASCFYFGD